MAFHIRNAKAEQLLRELQSLTGESLTEVIAQSLSDRLEKIRAQQGSKDENLIQSMKEVWDRLSLVKNCDPRPDDEILGYGSNGLPL